MDCERKKVKDVNVKKREDGRSETYKWAYVIE